MCLSTSSVIYFLSLSFSTLILRRLMLTCKKKVQTTVKSVLISVGAVLLQPQVQIKIFRGWIQPWPTQSSHQFYYLLCWKAAAFGTLFFVDFYGAFTFLFILRSRHNQVERSIVYTVFKASKNMATRSIRCTTNKEVRKNLIISREIKRVASILLMQIWLVTFNFVHLI